MNYREQGKNALSTIIKNENNIKIIEKYIYNASLIKNDKETSKNNYLRYIYQIIQDILDGNTLKTLLENIKNKKLGWYHSTFKEVTSKIEEQDDFIQNPFEVEEGVFECRCGSKRVYSYQKMCRGADEPMTSFAQCIECKNKWVYNG
jgi:DNA-directed RNA polymerase subunit M/transcription elongation factor TFIIS